MFEVHTLDVQNEPPDTGPGVEILRLRGGQSLQAILLTDVYGLWVHWDGRHTQPCFKNHEKCPGHLKEWPRKWKGYFDVLTLGNSGLRGFMEVTPTVVRSLWAQTGQKIGFRGLRVKLSRGNGNKAHFKISVEPPCEVRGKLPEGTDPYPILAKLWGLPKTGIRELSGGLEME